MAANIAIIGGTGLETLPPEIFAESLEVQTDGNPPRHVLSVSNNYVEPAKLYFLSRHGSDHSIAPHQINFRANTDVLKALGVSHIIATNAVGSLNRDYQPGDLVLFDDFIDFTRNRDQTYFRDGMAWKHTDFSTPYSPDIRNAIIEVAGRFPVKLHRSGTYLCVDGPRFESPAEVRLYANWGADVVGMTGLPEVVYAGEAGIQYAAIGIVTNLAAGLTDQKVSHDEVVQVMSSSVSIVRELILQACGAIATLV